MTDAIERYFRTWTRDGRRHLDAKLALAWDEYDDQRSGRLSSLEWDDHHATWDDEYQFETTDREPGAWTVDDTPATRGALRERGIDIPEEIPTVLEVDRKRRAEVDRECPECGGLMWTYKRILSDDEWEHTIACTSCEFAIDTVSNKVSRFGGER